MPIENQPNDARVNKGNSSISLFEIHKSIEKKKKQIWVTNQNWGKHIKCEENNDTTETQQLNATHIETNYNITMAIFLTWYRTF